MYTLLSHTNQLQFKVSFIHSMTSVTMMPSIEQLVEGEGGGEGGPTQEFKDLLSTLPREKWSSRTSTVAPLYQYKGFWNMDSVLQGMLKFQAQFKAQPTDLFLVSIPKSGATWLKAMAFATINRKLYPTNYLDQHPHPLLAKNPHELVPFLEFAYSANQVPDFTGFESPRLFATHLPYTLLPESITSSKCKIVYLCRNPKDNLISSWCFVNKVFKSQFVEPVSLEEVFERFCKGVSLFGPFWDHVLGYWKESSDNPERICFLTFEDMKREPMVNLRKLAEFLGCPFSLEEENEGVLDGILKLCSFDNLSHLEVNKQGKLAADLENNAFFRRGEVGDWENHLTPEMGKRLDQIYEEKLHGSGLKI